MRTVTNMVSDRLSQLIGASTSEARTAYEFLPSSYTFSAMSAALAVRQQVALETPPDWIAEFSQWSEATT